jgi:hypothetical protein
MDTKRWRLFVESASVFKATFTVSMFLGASLATVCLAACGSSSTTTSNTTSGHAATQSASVTGPNAPTAAQVPPNAAVMVGTRPITKAMLNRWMAPMVGGDFYESTHLRAPRGLVSEPPNYAACIAAIRAFGSKLTAAQITSKCEQLYEQIKEQVLTYLIEAEWSLDRDAEQGVTVSNQEIEAEFKRLEVKFFPKEGELQTYLANHEWPLSVELFLIKRDMLYNKLEKKFSENGRKAQFGRFLLDNAKQWTARTTCQIGYLVEQCNDYKSVPSTTSPDILIEEFVSSR